MAASSTSSRRAGAALRAESALRAGAALRGTAVVGVEGIDRVYRSINNFCQAGVSARVGDELQQRAVGIAEVHAARRPTRTVARDRPLLDLDAARAHVRRGLLDRPGPYEAEVGAAGAAGP